MTIEEIDRLVAPQFPMVGLAAPEEIKFTPYEWLAVVDRAIELVGEDHVMLGSDFDGGPTLPRGMRDVSRPAAAHRRDAAARLVGRADQEISRRQPPPRGPSSHREKEVTGRLILLTSGDTRQRMNRSTYSAPRPHAW